MVEQGILCRANEVMYNWQRLDLALASSHFYLSHQILLVDSLDRLSDLAVNLFSPIPNRGQTPLPSIPDHPFGPDEKGTLVHIQTIMDFHAMEISFPIDEQIPQWRFKP
jgi:secreted Zn-dependent insulinase-like peptidase